MSNDNGDGGEPIDFSKRKESRDADGANTEEFVNKFYRVRSFFPATRTKVHPYFILTSLLLVVAIVLFVAYQFSMSSMIDAQSNLLEKITSGESLEISTMPKRLWWTNLFWAALIFAQLGVASFFAYLIKRPL